MKQKENKIFQWLKPTENEMLHELTGHDLQTLLLLLDTCYLEYRDTLGLDPNITFGCEFELEHIKNTCLTASLKNFFPNQDWKIKDDLSLEDGMEINTGILRDTKENWQLLQTLCNIIDPWTEIDQKAAGHIHMGAHILGDDLQNWLHFFKLWTTYENILFRFAYGEYFRARPCLENYAQPMAKAYNECYDEQQNQPLSTIITDLCIHRNQAVNLSNVDIWRIFLYHKHNTIEFRLCNGSKKIEIWQNNINCFAHLLTYCCSPRFQEEIIEQRRKENQKIFSSLSWYQEIYLEQALEFCDLIFDNNRDKIFFLKQYIKALGEENDKTRYPQSHSLVKQRT